jgi:penicillin-binding protein 2A
VAVVVLFVGVFIALVELTPFDEAKLSATGLPTIVYAKDGTVLMRIQSEAGNLPYEKIPKNLQDAVVATEDHNFWDSSSIDLRGLLRAAFVDLWTGQLAQGGSTIQEQLAKIVFLNDQKTLTRKIQQIALGVQINRHYTKQEILAMYLNRVYLGEGCTGVEQAAKRYFNVDLARGGKLTLAQAALLAGLPQAPSAYDPILHPQAALKRRNQVLENMAKYGYISEELAKKTEQEPLGVPKHPYPLPDDPWDTQPLLMNFLIDYAKKNGIATEEEIMHGGLRIYTTIDPQVQAAVNKVFWEGAYDDSLFPPPIDGRPVDAAAIFIDPRTGGIAGAAGSRRVDYARLGYDRVYAQSSPGSSIKPLVVYAPAIETGKWGPDSILDNTPHDFGGGYIPYNDVPGRPARVTMAEALRESDNVAAVWLLQQIGVETGIQFAENAGIQFDPSDHHLAVALGGMKYGVTPYEMAQAYSAFANRGIEMQAHLITRIVNQQGDTIYQYVPSSKRVMSEQTAAVMTELLMNVVNNGTGQYAQVPGWDVAGKTGTVQWSTGTDERSGAYSNWVSRAWFDGYTPTLVGSVYLGYDEAHDPKLHLFWNQEPNHYAAAIFAKVVELGEAGRTPQHFSFNLPQVTNQPQQVQDPVTQLTASWDSAQNAVVLSWQSGMRGQVQFTIDRIEQAAPPGQAQAGAQGQGGTLVRLGTTADTSFVDYSAQPGATYAYVVQAVDPTTGSPVGSGKTVVITIPGGAPANLTQPAPGAGGGNAVNPPGNEGGPGNGTGLGLGNIISGLGGGNQSGGNSSGSANQTGVGNQRGSGGNQTGGQGGGNSTGGNAMQMSQGGSGNATVPGGGTGRRHSGVVTNSTT